MFNSFPQPSPPSRSLPLPSQPRRQYGRSRLGPQIHPQTPIPFYGSYLGSPPTQLSPLSQHSPHRRSTKRRGRRHFPASFSSLSLYCPSPYRRLPPGAAIATLPGPAKASLGALCNRLIQLHSGPLNSPSHTTEASRHAHFVQWCQTHSLDNQLPYPTPTNNLILGCYALTLATGSSLFC